MCRKANLPENLEAKIEMFDNELSSLNGKQNLNIGFLESVLYGLLISCVHMIVIFLIRSVMEK